MNLEIKQNEVVIFVVATVGFVLFLTRVRRGFLEGNGSIREFLFP
jgi:hypothetical protein